jgi:PIN domain nuclease of toxin-antitoxin system
MPYPYAVTDTHALIWAATGRLQRLGRRARRYYAQADAGDVVIYVPTTALVELGEAARAGRVQLSMPFVDWVDALLAGGSFQPYDLTVDVVRAAERLYTIPERGDRLIAATAVVLDCPLITRDPEVAGSASVELLWS